MNIVNHFLDKVRETARQHTGKRIVIIVGVEHGYWLRKRLREEKFMTLVDIEAVEQGNHDDPLTKDQ